MPNVVPSGSKPILPPEMVRPYPKKVVDKNSSSLKKGREKGTSSVFTDSPEKDRLQILCGEKVRKEEVKMMKQKAKQLKAAKRLLVLTETKKTKPKRRRRAQSDSDTSQNESLTFSYDDGEHFEATSDPECEDVNFDIPNSENIEIGDFLLIKFEKKKTVLYYVAKVISKYNTTDYQVSYLRKRPGNCTFTFPMVEDKASVVFSDVVLQLPKPIYSKGTTRATSVYNFSIDLSGYNVR